MQAATTGTAAFGTSTFAEVVSFGPREPLMNLLLDMKLKKTFELFLLMLELQGPFIS